MIGDEGAPVTRSCKHDFTTESKRIGAIPVTHYWFFHGTGPYGRSPALVRR